MGQVIRKAIKNILEAPLDVLVEFAGRGLERIIDSDVPQIAVKCGDGVELDDNYAVRVKAGHGCGHRNGKIVCLTGPGLVINDKDQVAVNPGPGVGVVNDQVVVKAGSGLGFDVQGQVQVLTGDNIVIKDGKVALDNVPIPDLESSTTFQVDSKLTLNGKRLILKKTFKDFTLVRNKAGFLLDIIETGMHESEDVIDLPESGYVAMLSVPNRETTAKSPNFYKK
jgi:hypothetical protein